MWIILYKTDTFVDLIMISRVITPRYVSIFIEIVFHSTGLVCTRDSEAKEMLDGEKCLDTTPQRFLRACTIYEID